MENKKTKKTRGLGKGLGALFENASIKEENFENSFEEKEEKDFLNETTEENFDPSKVVMLKLRDIEPNPNQPRKTFDPEKLQTLADSLKVHGMFQPILVQKNQNGMFLIIAGERRWRAAKLAKLKEIPCIIKDYEKQELMEIALIENLQREDLNPIEEAEGYKNLMETFDLTQEQISERVGKSRSAVANSLRLNNLKPEVKAFVIDGSITQGHARTLLALENANHQIAAADKIIKENLNVRQTEKLVSFINQNGGLVEKEKPSPDLSMKKYYEDIEKTLSEKFGTKVKISPGKNKSKIEIEYYSKEELERLLYELK